jgi:protein-S-isoprenylcysteine O-methyltransferase Ste14
VASTAGRRVPDSRVTDLGRLIMVPAAALMLVVDLRAQVATAMNVGVSVAAMPRWLSAALVCVFYALIIWSYLRRGPAVASTRSVVASAAAVLATLTPFTFPLLAGGAPGPARQLAADCLLVAGTAWSVWSLRCLGTNLSVIAQARAVADRGPYRLVRHPLYAGELTSSLGLVLAAGTVTALAIWIGLVGMQIYRATREEQVLLAALPGYRDYRARTAALLPGIF